MKKLVIGNKEIDIIKDFARKSFKKTPEFIGMDNGEIQAACILMGLESYLNSKGVPVMYEVVLKKHHDSMPIDEESMG